MWQRKGGSADQLQTTVYQPEKKLRNEGKEGVGRRLIGKEGKGRELRGCEKGREEEE